MSTLIPVLVFFLLMAAAAIASICDMRPQDRPPQWSIGRMLDSREPQR